MQMINKNRNGITLISLVVTLIVLFIILGITINYGLSELHNVSNKKTESELAIVQEAVMQRYALVKSRNQLEISAKAISTNTTLEADTDRPIGFVGTRIASSQEILNQGFSNVNPVKQYNSGANDLTYEEYYYLLTEDDLQELGIEKGDDSTISNEITPKQRSYIVNYLTGEVFDIATKKYYKTDMSNDDPVYKQPTSITMDEKKYDFNDENN